MSIQLRKCTMDDLEELRQIGRETYKNTFQHLNTPENMEAYLQKAFDRDKLMEELSNSCSTFYFFYCDRKLSGYMKLNDCGAQTDINDPVSLEVERIYVKQEFQRKGLGDRLMMEAIGEAAGRGRKYVWLGVWEKNEKAVRFYEKNGFYIMGRHYFIMGDEEQTDYVMRKDLNYDKLI